MFSRRFLFTNVFKFAAGALATPLLAFKSVPKMYEVWDETEFGPKSSPHIIALKLRRYGYSDGKYYLVNNDPISWAHEKFYDISDGLRPWLMSKDKAEEFCRVLIKEAKGYTRHCYIREAR